MSSKRIKILLTGSGGSLLGNFIRQAFFLKKPYVLSSIDKMDDIHTRNHIYINQAHSFNIADVLDYNILSHVFFKEDPDIVIHGAQDKTLKTNILGTKNIIDACLEYNKKLVFISSSTIYKNKAEITEDDSIDPTSEFAISKATCEMLIKNTPNLKYTIVRVGNYYGPWQKTNYFIPQVIKKLAIDKEEYKIDGQGNRMLDWTHVNDICSSLFAVVENSEKTNNKVYNIGSEQYFMDLETVHIICNHLGFSHDLIKFNNDVAKPINRHISCKKIRTELNWTPDIKFKDGVKDVIQWFLNNKFVYKL
jgi:dTDP-glucose 4,6-dehydratase